MELNGLSAGPDNQAAQSTSGDNKVIPQQEIVDYNDKDFVGYWDSVNRQLLNKIEFKIVSELLPQKTGWFIDIGCGFGRLAPVYLGNGRKTIMTDYSIKQLELAAERYGTANAYFVAADARNLPFRSRVFSSGICVRLVHHISNPQALLSECSRIFQPGAPMVINYINKRSLLRVLRYGIRCFKKNHERTSPIIFSTHPLYFKQLVMQSGFSIRRVRGAGFVHQAAYACKQIDRLIENTPLISKLMNLIEQVADASIGRAGFALMQYINIVNNNDQQQPVDPVYSSEEITDILMCPSCKSTEFSESTQKLECCQCKKSFAKVGNIYDFR